MRAIVTGGAGFIGSHVVDALVARGDEVAVVDSLVHGKRGERVVRRRAPRAGHPRAARRRLRRRAARGRLPPRRAGRRARLGRAPGRGRRGERARHRSHPRGGTSPRRAGRLLLDRRRDLRRVRRACARGLTVRAALARTARRSSPARSTSARTTVSTGRGTSRCATGTSTGPRQDPHGEAGVVAIFLGALARGEQAKIFGDGLQTRDYVYVGDVARATISTLGHDGGVFNVGTGRETSVVELYELCARVAGSDTPGRARTRAPRRAAAELPRPDARGARARVHARWSSSRTVCARPGTGFGQREGLS